MKQSPETVKAHNAIKTILQDDKLNKIWGVAAKLVH